jgi:hypothetical protein
VSCVFREPSDSSGESLLDSRSPSEELLILGATLDAVNEVARAVAKKKVLFSDGAGSVRFSLRAWSQHLHSQLAGPFRSDMARRGALPQRNPRWSPFAGFMRREHNCFLGRSCDLGVHLISRNRTNWTDQYPSGAGFALRFPSGRGGAFFI